MYHGFMPVITLRYNYLGRLQPALVAQLDARLTGNQEVMGSTPARFGSILLWRLSQNIFCGHSLLLIQEGQLSFLVKECAQIPVNH